jgi:hypothetical protein
VRYATFRLTDFMAMPDSIIVAWEVDRGEPHAPGMNWSVMRRTGVVRPDTTGRWHFLPHRGFRSISDGTVTIVEAPRRRRRP